jgi:hypothetical protein
METPHIDFAKTGACNDGLTSPVIHELAGLHEDKRVLRKVDFFLMPLLMVTFMLQYMDNVTLNGAAKFGIIQDLDLYKIVGYTSDGALEPILDLSRFSNATLIFYWGCLVSC